MLNTDAHTASVQKKMTQEEFIKMNRGINGGKVHCQFTAGRSELIVPLYELGFASRLSLYVVQTHCRG